MFRLEPPPSLLWLQHGAWVWSLCSPRHEKNVVVYALRLLLLLREVEGRLFFVCGVVVVVVVS